MSGMVPGPEAEIHHHHQTGHRWLDITLSVSAIAISLMTAVLAFQHGHAMELMVQQNARMVQASTWPYLSLSVSNADSQARPLFKINLANNGVGPAKVERVVYRYKGQPVPTAFALKDTLAKDARVSGSADAMQSDAGGVLAARQTVDLLTVQAPFSSATLIQAFRSAPPGVIDVEVCYCSIFDECWSTKLTQTGEPKPVKMCNPS